MRRAREGVDAVEALLDATLFTAYNVTTRACRTRPSPRDDGSRQEDLRGINFYPADALDEWIEYDSVINIRPRQGNRSRGVDDPAVRAVIREIVESLVVD